MGTQATDVERLLQPVRWMGDHLELIDQTALPLTYAIITCTTDAEVADAIRSMKVRGAPAIGVTAAYGFALAALAPGSDGDLSRRLHDAHSTLLSTRPTAVNLRWALARMMAVYEAISDQRSAVSGEQSVAAQSDGFRAARGDEAARERYTDMAVRLVEEARRIQQESYDSDLELSRLGAQLLAGRRKVLTHCNAGPLATAGYGTAVGVIRRLFEADPKVTVLADETRPFLQGARLTAWELTTLGIPVDVITDAMAGHLMSRGEIEAVIVGADRIAANGDVANKIGTYSLAVLARAHEIPFYVAAPTSTVDLSTPTGAEIPIEERDPIEVLSLNGSRIAAEGAGARHPAFDVTPHDLVEAIITEAGVAAEPYQDSLAAIMAGSAGALSGSELRPSPALHAGPRMRTEVSIG